MSSFFSKAKKEKKDEHRAIHRSASVTIYKPKTKNKAVSEYYGLVDELCHLLVQNDASFCCHLVTLDLGLTSIPRIMNTFSIFKKLVGEEYLGLGGDTSLLLRNTSHATKWMKGIVEAESADMFLLEKRVLWLLNKGATGGEADTKSPKSPVRTNLQGTPKKSSFLAPSVAVHQQIIQKEETPEGAGFEWVEDESLKVINEFDADLKELVECILGIFYCCSQVNSLCRLATATCDEVRRMKRNQGTYSACDDDEFSCGSSSPCILSRSDSTPSREGTIGSLGGSMGSLEGLGGLKSSHSSPTEKKKDKKKKGKASPLGKARAMRRKVTEEESELYCWSVTNILLLHFAVPVIASRSVKCKPEKRIVKFSKLVARSIMKVAANSEMNKGTDFEKYNPAIRVLHPAYLNFCQDVVDTGIGYPNYAPEIKRASLTNLKNDMTAFKADEFSSLRDQVLTLCDLVIKKGAMTKKINRQHSSELPDADDSCPSYTEDWRAPTLLDASQLGDDDFSEACPTFKGDDSDSPSLRSSAC